MYNLLMDDVRHTNDLFVKSCRVCRFAHGGQYFAAVQGPQILIFGTYSLELLCSLKGHSGAVRSISWREGDLGLVSSSLSNVSPPLVRPTAELHLNFCQCIHT